MLTLGLLKTEMAQFMVDETIATRLSDWAYWVMTDLISGPHKFWWNKKKANLTTVSGTAEYFLSSRVNGLDVLWMGDTARTGYEITKVGLEKIYGFDPTPTDSGDPEVWAPVELADVQASNTATTSSATSTSASDLSITVLIRGEVSSKDRSETISLNGTASATPSSPLTWDADSVYSVTLSTAAVGTVTVTIGNVVAVIPPGLVRIQCPRIRVWRVPSSALTLPYIYYQKPLKLIADSDVFDVPDFAIDAVLKGLFYWGYKNNGDIPEANASFQEYLVAKDKLRSFSQTEVRSVDRKEWNVSSGDVPYTIPRTITYTVS